MTEASVTHPPEPTGPQTNFPTVGRWLVTAVPNAWMFVAGFGVRQIKSGSQDLSSNIALGEDLLAQPELFGDYIRAQLKLIDDHLAKPAFAGPQVMAFPGADEAALLFIRHVAQNAVTMLHVQTYVRSGTWLGIVTLTTPEADLKMVRPDYDGFVRGLRILSV